MRYLICSLLAALVFAWSATAQSADTTHLPKQTAAAGDSLATALNTALDEARVNEITLRLEVERLRQGSSADSARRAEQRRMIDSLRSVVTGYPVVVEGDTLYYRYTKRGGYTPEARADMDAKAILLLGSRLNLSPDSLYLEHSDILTDLMYGNRVILSITDQDGLWEDTTREGLAERLRGVVVDKLVAMRELHGWMQVGKRALFFLLVVAGQYLLFRLTNCAFRRAKRRVHRLRNTRLKSILVQNYELLDTRRQVRLLIFLANIVRYIVILLQLLVSIPMLFAIFPQTKELAYTILSYIWEPISSILHGIMHYIPNLFTILIIYYVIKYVIKGVRYMATEIESEKLRIHGFYPDWAMPTYHIVRFLLYAFMIAMIYPYLPGSDSGIFQGISVFVGLIISLGSSAVVGNIIAGLVITYMRPFRLGDRIKLNDTTGNVIEKTAFVTRLRTPKNEVVTIPNSFIMSSHTVNYSASARSYGLLIQTEVTIGYDVPWRKVHQLLIEAALATPGVDPTPEPFVLEASLKDYYPVYQLHACIRNADHMASILSDLNQHIQDHFAQGGVEIMSPAYTAYRNGNASTIPNEPKK